MEDREDALPIATVRPRRFLGRLSALRGAASRWVRARLRHVRGRHAVLLLTGVFFSVMMLCMGYVADRANRAADAIDEAQAAARSKHLSQNLEGLIESARSDRADDAPAEPPASPPVRDHVLFYVTGSEH